MKRRLDLLARAELDVAASSRCTCRRRQRGCKVPDLLIAAAAEAGDLRILHYDPDFDLIAAVTGQRCEWVVAAGSVD